MDKQKLQKYFINYNKGRQLITEIIKENEGIFKNEYIKTLITYHPTKVIEYEDIKHIAILYRPPYNNKALFYFSNANTTYDDVSYKTCLKFLFDKFDKNLDEKETEVLKYREIINCFSNTKRTFVKENQNHSFCDICKTSEDLCIDHYEIPFIQIYNEYAEHNKNKNDDDWIKYHDSRAKYRYLCRKCNSKLGSYDYRKKSIYKKGECVINIEMKK